MPPWGHFAPTVGQNAPSIVYIYFRFSQLQFFYYCKITLHVVQQNMKFRLTVLLCRKMHKCSRKLQKNVRGGVLPHPTLITNIVYLKQHFPLFMAALHSRMRTYIYFHPVVSSSFFFISSPNLSGRTLDVYHTSTHGVVLVQI